MSAHAITGYTMALKIAVGWMRDDTRLEFHRDGARLCAKYAEVSHLAEIRARLRGAFFFVTKMQLDVGPDFGTVVPMAAVQRAVPFNNRIDEYTVRGDANLSSKHRFWGRYFWQKSPNVNGGVGVDGWTYDNPQLSRQTGGGWNTHILLMDKKRYDALPDWAKKIVDRIGGEIRAGSFKVDAEAIAKQGEFFWALHDLLFDRQSSWSSESNPRETLAGYAAEDDGVRQGIAPRGGSRRGCLR